MALRFLVPAATVVLVIVGLAWWGGSGPTEASKGQTMSALQPQAHVDVVPDVASLVEPALFDPCAASELFALEAIVLMVAGLEHEAFIALAIALNLREICLEFAEGSFIASPDTPAPPREVRIEAQAGSNFVPVEGMFDPSTGMFEGEGVGTVAGFPNITVEMTMQVQENGDFEATYTMGANGELPGGNPGVYEITGTFDLSGFATPTPTSDPTPSETPSPTEPAGQTVVWGNHNCSGDSLGQPDPVDALLNLRHDAGLSTNTGDCPEMGSQQALIASNGLIWGDVDCDGAAGPVDSLKVLRFDAGLSVSQGDPCPEMGSEITLALG